MNRGREGTDPFEGGISGARDAVGEGSATPRDLVRASLDAIEDAATLNAVVEVRPQAVDEVRAEGALAGIPVIVKDCFVDGGRAPSMGSRLPAGSLTGTATVLERLRAEGAAIVAYANLHEWMVGATSLVTASGPVVNPLDPLLVTGGSSGGCAAALAAGLAPLAVGTDAGGSIRIPAACCAVVGFKPSRNAIPDEGFADAGSPIDHIGPMAVSVEDVAALFEVMAARTVAWPSVSRVRVGLLHTPLAQAAPAVEAQTKLAARRLAPHVAEVREVELEGWDDARSAVAGFILHDVARAVAAESDSWARLLQGPTVRVLRSPSATDDAHEAAIATRSRIFDAWDRLFTEVDVVLSPTLPSPVAPAADPTAELRDEKTSAERAYVAWNAPMNLGGVPCLSVPAGRLPGGSPFSVSITAPRDSDELALAVGRALESLGLAEA